MTSDSEQMDKEAGRAVGAVGMIFFASVMMVMIGFFHAMYGLAAILKGTSSSRPATTSSRSTSRPGAGCISSAAS